MSEYYQNEHLLEDRFGTIRGQVSYGILESLRRLSRWLGVFAVTVVLAVFDLMARHWLPASIGFDYPFPFLNNLSNVLQLMGLLYGLWAIFFGALCFKRSRRMKQAALSADAGEVAANLDAFKGLLLKASIVAWVILIGVGFALPLALDYGRMAVG